jgi:hypothetical protein
MDSPAPEPAELSPASKAQLLRTPGLGFGIAVVFGGTIGVGILRLRGTVAAQLGNFRLILAVWVVGGMYALLGSTSVAELVVMASRAGQRKGHPGCRAIARADVLRSDGVVIICSGILGSGATGGQLPAGQRKAEAAQVYQCRETKLSGRVRVPGIHGDCWSDKQSCVAAKRTKSRLRWEFGNILD